MLRCALACFAVSYPLWLSDQSRLYLWKLLHCKMCTFNTALVRHQSHLCTISHRFTRIKASAACFMNHHYTFEPFEPSQARASPRDYCDTGGLALFYRVRHRNSSWRHLSLEQTLQSRLSKPNAAAWKVMQTRHDSNTLHRLSYLEMLN